VTKKEIGEDPSALGNLLRLSGALGRIPDRARIFRQARRQEAARREGSDGTPRRSVARGELALSTPHAAAAADAYPARPIRFVVAFPRAGGTDIHRPLDRAEARRAPRAAVVIDNRPARAATRPDIARKRARRLHDADGLRRPARDQREPVREDAFDPVRDLAPVTLAESRPTCSSFILRSGGDGEELIALAKARPGEINFASRVTARPRSRGELFNSMAGVKLVHVPYKARRPRLPTARRQVQLMFSTCRPRCRT